MHSYASHRSVVPHTSVHPQYIPHTTVCSSIPPSIPHMLWGLWGSLYTPYIMGILGVSVHQYTDRHFCVCQYIHLPLRTEQSYWLLTIIVGHFSNGWEAYGCMLSFMLFTCSFLCSVFNLSQASATMTMTTTPPVTVVCSSISSLLTTITMDPCLMGLPAVSGQHDVVLPPLLIPRDSGGVVGLATVLQQQPQSQMPLQAYAKYAMGPPQIVSFRVEPCTMFLYVLVSDLVYAFYFQVSCCMPCSPMRAQPLGFAPLQPYGAYP